MKHLVTNYWDLENNVFKDEPDDFILPEDDGGEQRQRDTDLNAELKRITREQIKVLENLDPELFLEELDPDWRERFITDDGPDVWMGINFYMEFMSPAEFKKVLKASQ